jgi:hypothetical protein
MRIALPFTAKENACWFPYRNNSGSLATLAAISRASRTSLKDH